MNQFRALLIKELKEAIRDRRAFMAAMIMAVLAPVLIYVSSVFAIEEAVEKPDVYIYISGAESAPDLVGRLAQENIFSATGAPDDDLRKWSDRRIELLIPDDYAADMRSGRSIDLVLRADMSDTSLSSPLRRIRNAINDYSRGLGVKRVLLRGIDINLLRPITVEEQDLSAPNSSAAFINTMLLFYLLFGAFITGLSVAVDTSAGERERNVLEFLLCQPVPTYQVVAAKLLTASCVAVIGVVLTLALTSIAVGFIDLSKVGATFSLSAATVALLLLLLIPLCLFASSVHLLLAFQAKTFKEAQSIVSMVIVVPAFIPFALMLMENKPTYLQWLPISGQYLLMEDLLKGLSIEPLSVIAVTLTTAMATFGLFAILARRLQSEKTVLALS
ncbi:MAG: ABC transporter permease [Pseudomonadota bacterium]